MSEEYIVVDEWKPEDDLHANQSGQMDNPTTSTAASGVSADVALFSILC
jgi:hypothetical protein